MNSVAGMDSGMNYGDQVTARGDRIGGAATQVGTEISINFGAALAGLLIPLVGSVLIVTVRQVVTAAVVVPFNRPRLRGLAWSGLWPALALGVVLCTMNLSYYEAIARLGLGMAATIEFLGPMALALWASRRGIDVACAVAAAGGVALLTATGGSVNLIGVLLGLVAAVSWAAYILLTRRVALTLPGLQGLSIASIVATLLLLPVALVTLRTAAIGWRSAGLLAATALLSSAIPYSLDTFILRRLSARLYAILTSCGPVVAAVFGWLVLHERFALQQQLGILVVCLAAATAIGTQRDSPKSELEATADAIA